MTNKAVIKGILEKVVDYCHGNIWHDYKRDVKNPVLDDAVAQLCELIVKERLAEQYRYQGMLKTTNWISFATEVDKRIKELNSLLEQE